MLHDNAGGVADRLDAATERPAGLAATPGLAAAPGPGAVPGPDAVGAIRPARPRPGDLAAAAALSRLLGGKRFGRAVYVGREYGPVGPVLRACADSVTVAEPGPLDVDDASADLVVMISVLQQRPDPADDFAEIARVLRNGALAVIAAASVLHGAGRGRYRRSPQAITGSPAVTGVGLGHHPETLMLQLAVCGLQVERLLPGSRPRHPVLDRVLPGPVRRATRFAAPASPDRDGGDAGPTLFFLARKYDLARHDLARGGPRRHGLAI
jgi:SAM-dependent methyltransferase